MKKRNGTILALGLASLALSVAATATSLAKGAMMTKAEDASFAISYKELGSIYASSGATASVEKTVGSGTVTVEFSGVNTQSKTGSKYTYAMFVKDAGYCYSSTAIDGYYPSSVSATFSSQTGESGKIGITYGASPITTRDSKVTGAVKKSGTFTLENADPSLLYWNLSTTGANVQITNFSITYSTVSSESSAFSVRYNANGGTGEVTDSSEYLAGASATVLAGDALSKENYEFAGWNTEADGTGTAYNPGDSLVVEGDTTLYAQWNRTHYVVTYNPNGGTGDAFTEKVAVADASSYVAAANTAFTNGSYDFDGWATSKTGAVVYAVGDSVALTDDLTLYAHWDIPTMAKIASNDGLYEGMSVIIGNADGSMVMGAQSGNNCPAIASTGLVPGAGFASLTLGIEDTVKGIRYTFHNGTGYLYAASSSKNYLQVQTTLDDNGRWDINLATSTVKATGTNTHNLLRYNSSSKLFSSYETGQAAIALYALPQTITDEQIANTFIKKYMHLDSAPVGETGEGKCVSESWYASAKEAFNKLTEDQRLLVTNNADVYARLQTWAVANGDEMTGDLILSSKSAPFRSEVEAGQDKNVAIAVTTCGLGLVSAASLLLLRRKKQDRE